MGSTTNSAADASAIHEHLDTCAAAQFIADSGGNKRLTYCVHDIAGDLHVYAIADGRIYVSRHDDPSADNDHANIDARAKFYKNGNADFKFYADTRAAIHINAYIAADAGNVVTDKHARGNLAANRDTDAGTNADLEDD